MQDGLEPHAHLKGHMDLSSASISLANLSTATSNRGARRCFFGCHTTSK